MGWESTIPHNDFLSPPEDLQKREGAIAKRWEDEGTATGSPLTPTASRSDPLPQRKGTKLSSAKEWRHFPRNKERINLAAVPLYSRRETPHSPRQRPRCRWNSRELDMSVGER
jgi:hypothetical protein